MCTPRSIGKLLLVLCVASSTSSIHAAAVIHWINNSNQNAGTVLNTPSVFFTHFRTAGDVIVTKLGGTLGGLFSDNFGGPTPGNNPDYLKNHVGSSASGTGSGAPGSMGFLDLGGGATSSVRLDFATPLTSVDRLLMVDIDSNEKYHIEAFALVSGNYQPVSLAGWTYEPFSGQTGVTPTTDWPTWDGPNGLLTAGTVGLSEELSVLTPNQPVSRLIISKLNGAGFSTGIQVIRVTGVAGDYNENGVVDAADYVVWRENRNTANVLPNDPIGSTIDTPQYDQWRTHFGQAGGSAASAGLTGVPEPAVAVPLTMLAVAMSIARRRR